MPHTKSSVPKVAVILAAGSSSRFVPFVTTTHKSATVIAGKPIILWTVAALIQNGVEDVHVVVSPQDLVLKELLSGVDKVKIREQLEPKGMANALLSIPHIESERLLLLDPQQVNIGEYLKIYESSRKMDEVHVVLFHQKTLHPEKYGMLQMVEERVVGVVEKPTDPTAVSDQRICGTYILTPDFIQELSKFKFEQYQFEACLDLHAKQEKVVAIPFENKTLTLKYAWDLIELSKYVLHAEYTRLGKGAVHPTAVVHPTAIIDGEVILAEGAKVYEYAILKGPVYIGKNAVVGSYCKLRNGTVLEEGVELQNAVEVRGSLIGKGTHIHSGFVGDSVLGSKIRIGAGFLTANKRLDRQTVILNIGKEKRVDSGLVAFGALIGNGAKIGIHCGTNPGTIIPADAVLLPGTIQ